MTRYEDEVEEMRKNIAVERLAIESAMEAAFAANRLALEKIKEDIFRLKAERPDMHRNATANKIHQAPPQSTWEDDVRALYMRSPKMEVAEFEALLTVAMRGERPDHPNLPAYLPLDISLNKIDSPPREYDLVIALAVFVVIIASLVVVSIAIATHGFIR